MSRDKTLLSKKVADEIVRMIVSEKYKTDEKIPNEMQLSKKLDVSRTTIREAIKILCSMNILEIKRGNGTFVCKNPGIVDDPLGIRFIESGKKYHDLRELRLILEPEIAALTASKATDEQVEEIIIARQLFDEAFEKFIKGEMEIVELLQFELSFHMKIAESCNNVIIKRISSVIYAAIIQAYYGKASIFNEQRPNYSLGKLHEPIIKAIQNKNPEEARIAMKRHIIGK
jgi:GntR family transcriptional repressor for pyruvate dehydrogenase complex